jgi:hypothetical protein
MMHKYPLALVDNTFNFFSKLTIWQQRHPQTLYCDLTVNIVASFTLHCLDLITPLPYLCIVKMIYSFASNCFLVLSEDSVDIYQSERQNPRSDIVSDEVRTSTLNRRSKYLNCLNYHYGIE